MRYLGLVVIIAVSFLSPSGNQNSSTPLSIDVFSSQALNLVGLTSPNRGFWGQTPRFLSRLIGRGAVEFPYKDKVVFITGASSGLGEAMAREFAQAGAKVVLLARRKDRLDKIAAELLSQGHAALAIKCDVTKPSQIRRAVQITKEQFGSIDLALLNAGVEMTGTLESLSERQIRYIHEVNTLGMQFTAKEVMPDLIQTKGHLVVMGSVLGRVGMPEEGTYVSSKFAAFGLAQTILMEQHGLVRVTYLAPGHVKTEMPIPEWVDPADIMPVDKAARRLYKGILKEKWIVYTHWSGRFAGFIARVMPSRAPWLMNHYIRIEKAKHERKKKDKTPPSPPASPISGSHTVTGGREDSNLIKLRRILGSA
jgi:NADP-dependent 3-hydroxy acid dehydrogenase YdfG